MKINFIRVLLIIITFITINSCERDDICIDEITPHLIVRFYDNDNNTLFKKFSQLSVKVMGIENDSLSFSSTDSILIPLKVTDNSTQFILTLDSDQNTFIRDTLTVNYDPSNVFVGRSCGFKTIFNNTNYLLDSNNWIHNVETITQTIDNETGAHVKIFH